MVKTEYRTVKLSQIPHSPKFQVRKKGTDKFHVARLTLAYTRWKEEGGECPVERPVLWKIGNIYHLTKGFHRLEAMRSAGLTEAEFEVRLGGTISDAAIHASESNNDHNALPMNKDDTKIALLMYYDHVLDAKLLTDKALGERFHIDRRTVKSWLAEHDDQRSQQTERIRRDGKKVAVQTKAATMDIPVEDESEEVAEPEIISGQGSVAVEDKGEPLFAPQPLPDPRKKDEYPPDPRFMPNAEEAAKLAKEFASFRASLSHIAGRLKALLPDPSHPIANRMHLHTTFLPTIGSLIEDLVNNSPTDTCPKCAGTTLLADGTVCRDCNGYGLVSAGDAAEMKGQWKAGSGERYDALVREADISEMTE